MKDSLSFFPNGPDLKRKLEENGVGLTTSNIDSFVPKLTPKDVRKIVDKEKLIDIVADTASRHVDALRSLADFDASQHKLFIRGLGWDTTTDGLDCSSAG